MKIRFLIIIGISILCFSFLIACPGFFDQGLDIDEEDQCFALDRNYSIGGHGSEQGEFNLPLDIDLDKDGFQYITDSSNSRIQKFNPGGVFITEFGNDNLLYPHGIAVSDNGYVYVADKGNNRILRFDTSGNGMTQLSYDDNNDSVDDPGEFYHPEDIDVTYDDDYLAVYDKGNNRLQLYDGSNWIIVNNYYTDSSLNENNKININNVDILNIVINKDKDDNLFLYLMVYKSSPESNFVLRLAKAPAEYKFYIDLIYGNEEGTVSSQLGYFNKPQGMDILESQFLFIADSLNDRIQLYEYEGDFVEAWERDGLTDTTQGDKLNFPTGIAVYDNLDVYVIEPSQDKVKKFIYRCEIEE
jgi:DNA-binding beta-propeller fold protein YncE